MRRGFYLIFEDCFTVVLYLSCKGLHGVVFVCCGVDIYGYCPCFSCEISHLNRI
nr:MAG TPA: hypothetical protein [Caudoviricetes sp.]